MAHARPRPRTGVRPSASQTPAVQLDIKRYLFGFSFLQFSKQAKLETDGYMTDILIDELIQGRTRLTRSSAPSQITTR